MKRTFVALTLVALLCPVLAHPSQIVDSSCSAVNMAKDATDIFVGVCTNVKVVPTTGQFAFSNSLTEYTFGIREIIKGDKNVGDTIKAKMNNIKTVALPNFKCDNVTEYGVFLNGETVVALTCGKIDFTKDQSGATVVKGLSSKQAFFKDVPMRKSSFNKSLNSAQKDVITKPDAKITKDDFVTIMKAIVNEQQGGGEK